MILAVILAFSAMLLVVFILPGLAQPQSNSGLRIIKASPGQVIPFDGKGEPNSDVYLTILTSTRIDAPGGRYGIALNGIQIPSGTNKFSITASRVETMTVSGSSSSNGQISATQGVDVKKNGVGSLSKSNIPAGTYSVMVYGTTKDSKVDVSASAGCAVHVDGSGNYHGSVSTQGMPAGLYTVKQDNKEIAHIYLA
jgi:hypothetical protein